MSDNSTFKAIYTVFKLEPKTGSIAVCLIIIATLSELFGIGILLPILKTILNSSSEASRLEQIVINLINFIGIDKDNLISLLLTLVVAFIVKGFIVFIAQRQIAVIVIRFGTKRRHELMSALTSAKWSYFVNHSTASIINSIGMEISGSTRAASQSFHLISQIVQAPIYLIGALFIDPLILIGLLAASLIFIVGFYPFISIGKKAGKNVRTSQESLSTALADILVAVKPIKAMHQEKLIKPILEKKLFDLNKYHEQVATVTTGLMALREPIFVIFISAFIYITTEYTTTPLDMTIIIGFIFYRLLNNVSIIQHDFQAISVFQTFLFSTLKRINEARKFKEIDTGKDLFFNYNKIIFDKVEFKIKESKILKNISANFAVNKITLVTGESGSGKTTVADILMRLREPTAGNVYIDQKNLKNFSLKSWREHIGYVPQDPFLINDNIINNVSLYNDSIKIENIYKALELADILKFVKTLPEGIYSNVGERGNRLSGGQKQRLMIARALVVKPKLLILDEPTSGLDHQSVVEIHETLNNLKEKMTIVIISHDDQAKNISDYVYTLNKGEII
ncbi:ABC transporter ATP-binding protein/permease [Alphaproteobacteria bacterium]|nr:ABC transporter ATP-binding protein/permease [Alphaproteobacteria bacterium]